MSELEIVIRVATREEASTYCIPAWLNSYAQSFIGKLGRADARHAIGRENYWNAQRAKIERILSTPTVSLRVATVDDEIVGFVCDDQTRRRVHFVFTNRAFRRQGVARALIPGWFDDPKGGLVSISHLPPPWYSRPGPDGSPPPWQSHVAIDLVTSE